MKSKIFLVFVALLLLLVTSASDSINNIDVSIWNELEESSFVYSEHDPIVISSNEDFESQGWPGTGIESNPYLIEGLNITSDGICVNISDTTSHFIITNCIITSDTPSDKNGIHIQNVTHGVVRDSIIEWHGHGLYLNSSAGFVLINNTANQNSIDGFYIDHSDHCILRENVVDYDYGGLANGFVIFYSSNCSIIDCDASWLPNNGFFLTDSMNCQVINCTANYNSDYGFMIRRSNNCTLSGNTANNNLEIGFYFYYSDNCTAMCNIVNNNSENGFYLFESNGCLLEENEAYSNKQAIFIDFSFDCNMTKNIMYGCETGVIVQYSNQISFSNNQILDNTLNGVHIYYSENCTLANNNASINGVNGFYIVSSSFIDLITNFVTLNGQDGIRFEMTNDSQLIMNSLLNNSESGAFFYSSPNRCGIINNSILFNKWGLFLQESPETNISYNYLYENIRGGLVLWGSSYCSINQNRFERDGIYIVDAGPESSWNHTFTGNTVNEKPIGYFLGESDLEMDGGAFSQIIIASSNNVTIRNGTFDDGDRGVQIGFSTNCTIINSTANGNTVGIWLYQSEFCNVINCTIEDNTERGVSAYSNLNFSLKESTLRGNDYYTVLLFGSQNAKVISNYIVDNLGDGIHIPAECNGSEIINNTICGNRRGIHISSHKLVIHANFIAHNIWANVYVWSIYNVEITNNTIIGSASKGIFLEGMCESNQIHYNKIGWNLDGNIDDSNTQSNWDDGLSLGNYWDDYTGIGTYSIQGSAGSVDNLPQKLIDFTAPSINEHSDFSFERGSVGNSIEWDARDDFPKNYTIFNNGEIISQKKWYGFNISFCLDQLEFGIHNITVQVYDFGGSFALDSVNVSVLDSILPSIDGPSYKSVSEGSIGNNITWLTSDYSPSTYAIYINNTNVFSDVWIKDVISYLIDHLTLGEYNITLELYDMAMNKMTDTVWVSIVDVTVPTIDTSPDVEYVIGMVNQWITWTVYDLHPNNYTIFLNDSILIQDDWYDLSITINIDGLEVGTYNYTVLLVDSSGNANTDTVLVFVNQDTSPPEIDNPSNIIIEEGSVGNSIIWHPTDLNPSYYEVYRNRTLRFSDTWNGSQINVSLDDLPMGIYNFTLIVLDASGTRANDTVFVTVLDITFPVIDSPQDIEYEERTTNHSIMWSPSDTHPHFYEIYCNNSLIETGNWNGSQIFISIDGLDSDWYNYTLVVHDICGNSASDQVIVIVFESIATTTTIPTTTTGTTTTDVTNTTYETNTGIEQLLSIITIGSLIFVVAVLFLVFHSRKS